MEGNVYTLPPAGEKVEPLLLRCGNTWLQRDTRGRYRCKYECKGNMTHQKKAHVLLETHHCMFCSNTGNLTLLTLTYLTIPAAENN